MWWSRGTKLQQYFVTATKHPLTWLQPQSKAEQRGEAIWRFWPGSGDSPTTSPLVDNASDISCLLTVGQFLLGAATGLGLILP